MTVRNTSPSPDPRSCLGAQPIAARVFAADATRAGATQQVKALVDEMCATSPDFARLWRDHHGEGTKFIKHKKAGLIGLSRCE